MADKSPKTRLWEPAKGPLVLCAFGPWGHIATYELNDRQVIGRVGGDADIALPSQLLSTRHGETQVMGSYCLYHDLGSTNGTLVNGHVADGVVTLQEGDALGFAPHGDAGSVSLVAVVCAAEADSLSWERVPFGADVQEVVLGRSRGLTRDDAYLSEQHGSFFRSSEGPMVLDLMSTNGVFVNGKQVEGASPISPLDVVRMGTTLVVVLEDALLVSREKAQEPAPTAPVQDAMPEPAAAPKPLEVPAVPAQSTAPQPLEVPAAPAQPAAPQPPRHFEGDSLVIDIVEKNVWDRVKKKTLLRDLHLTIEPGDFVLILGGSGAGKSTFINAVMGNDKAEGSIRYGDLDVYQEYDRIRYQIGYVPQQDLLRLNDRVFDTLLAAAEMRMPRGTRRRELEDQARWASETLGLSREEQTLVGRLSGGQRKRLSIAVELVGDPSLFFLDEPDSGLDGIMARSLMENLRDIADLGKMVLVITHGPDRAADLFTKVLVLAKSERDGSGHMAFFGGIQEAKAHFGAPSLEGIVRRINRVDEGGEGRADEYIDLWEGR